MDYDILKTEDIMFKSNIFNKLSQRLVSYIAALTSFIFPDLITLGIITTLKNLNYLIIIAAIATLLLIEILLRFFIHEYKRFRRNKDNRNKMLALPKGVFVKDILPFTVDDYFIKYKFYWNDDKSALNIQRIEEGKVFAGTCNISVLRYDLLRPFRKEFTQDDLSNKISVEYKADIRSDLHVAHEKWVKDDSGMLLYQVNFTDELEKESNKKLLYSVVTTIKNYVPKEHIIKECSNQILEYIVLEIKNVTLCLDFPDNLIISEKDFIAIGKSNVLLKNLVTAIKNTKINKKGFKNNSTIIKIETPAPDVKYGFQWNWSGIIN